MKMRKPLILSSCLLMILLIFDAKTVLLSAQDGIKLCLYTVIPSLFPFFVICGILNSNIIGINLPFLTYLNRRLSIPDGADSIFLLGILGGYPVGAKCIGDCYRNGTLNKAQAQQMLGFCSNCGPSFIFGICGSLFTSSLVPFLLWCIQVLSAIMTAFYFSKGQADGKIALDTTSKSITQVLRSSISAIAEVCGWVILFRILLHLADRWLLWLLPDLPKYILYGFLELTNGCITLQNITYEPLRFLLCSAFLSFGGCCVILQTASVINGCGIDSYLRGKAIQTLISIGLACFVSNFIFKEVPKGFFSTFIVITIIYLISLHLKHRKKVVA